MLRKLRRGSKDPSDDITSRARRDSAVGPMASVADMEVPSQRDSISFFDLPPELRNYIYELVMCDATLSLPTSILASKRLRLPFLKRRQAETPINSLLLANRQTRYEYLSMLLSTAPVLVEVKDFDFEDVARVSSTLNPADTQALKSNPRLVLQLYTQNCSDKDVSRLKRWLQFRKNSGVDLPWQYEFAIDRLMPGTTMGRVRLLRELEYYADTIATLVVDLDESQKCEIQRVIHAFESCAAELEENLGWLGQRSKASSRALRGLAGGGLH